MDRLQSLIEKVHEFSDRKEGRSDSLRVLADPIEQVYLLC